MLDRFCARRTLRDRANRRLLACDSWRVATGDTMTDLDPRLSDEEAQAILARALELQQQGAGTLTMTQVRAIAAELSIPEFAVDQALSEYRARASVQQAVSSTVTAPTPRRQRRGAKRWLYVAASTLGVVVCLYVIGSILVRF